MPPRKSSLRNYWQARSSLDERPGMTDIADTPQREGVIDNNRWQSSETYSR